MTRKYIEMIYNTTKILYCDMLSRWQRCYSNVVVPVA
jgi:hypothetical protein